MRTRDGGIQKSGYRRARLFCAIAAVLGLTACKDIDRFSTKSGESYCGKIVSASIVRRGFSSTTCMRLTFDAELVSAQPGMLWTDDGMFDATPLRPIPELSHDPLLMFTFGEGREKNFLFAANPTESDRGPAVMTVLSLMHSGDAEVRLLRGAPGGIEPPPPPDAGPDIDGPPLFGVFAPLTRRTGACRDEPGCAWAPE
jgi:hypothetical protein